MFNDEELPAILIGPRPTFRVGTRATRNDEALPVVLIGHWALVIPWSLVIGKTLVILPIPFDIPLEPEKNLPRARPVAARVSPLTIGPTCRPTPRRANGTTTGPTSPSWPGSTSRASCGASAMCPG